MEITLYLKRVLGIWFLLVMLAGISVAQEDSLLVIRVEGHDFNQAVIGMKEELEDDISYNEMIIDNQTRVADLSAKIKIVQPKIVILMDNKVINLYKSYQKQQEGPFIPTVSILASFMDLSISGLKNATGIFYEVPLVTSIVNLRAVLPAMTLDKVGVINRECTQTTIAINQKYCQRENIELLAYQIPNKRKIKSKIKKELKRLKKKNIDALWIPNDSYIVNPRLLKSLWIPFAKKFKKPIIVGVEVLAEPRFHFGTFAVIPDHLQIGVRVAQMVYDIMDNDWKVEEQGRLEQPRSVYKIINLPQVENITTVDKVQLKNVIDKILK